MGKIVYDVMSCDGGKPLETFNKRETAERVLDLYVTKYYPNAYVRERRK